MKITEAFVLPPDTLLVPVEELSADARSRLDVTESDVAITRTRSRVVAKIVDAGTATLLRHFESPCTIAEGVYRSSRILNIDPEAMLRDAFPVLRRLIDAGYLLPADHPSLAVGGVASLDYGAVVGTATVIRCIHALDDIELYLARMDDGRSAALKIAQQDSDAGARSLASEAQALAALDAQVTPALWQHASHAGRPYVLMEWRGGVDAATAAQELRPNGITHSRERLAGLLSLIGEAYAHLHARGVVHGDVHEHNMLVDIDGRVSIIDFGYARVLSSPTGSAEPERGGIGHYYEPEFARARLAHDPLPPCTERSEQYSLAAMMYTLASGATYLDFRLANEEALGQIAGDSTRSFIEAGAEPWPELEAVLQRALAKDPEGRFPSTREFVAALQRVAQAAVPTVATQAMRANGRGQDFVQLDELVRRCAIGGRYDLEGITTAPTCSVEFGGAGVAYALYRLALVNNDARILAAADVWSTRSVRQMRRKGSLSNPVFEITADTVDKVSLFHSAPGVYLVQCLVAQALGDFASLGHAMHGFVRTSRRKWSQLDLTLGRAGSLLGGAILLDALPAAVPLPRRSLEHLGTQIVAELEAQLAAVPPIGQPANLVNIGVAHGWGGILYAILCWHQALGSRAAPELHGRLRELADSAEPYGRGLRWRWRYRGIERLHASAPDDAIDRSEGYMPGWCNGSAGLAMVFVAAHRTFPAAGFLDVATAAAWNAWEDYGEGVPDLCCGAAGRAYAMLALYRATGDSAWLRRASDLAHGAVEALNGWDLPETSLYKGALGVALLRAELRKPHSARMPFFEIEGWTR